MIRLLHPLFAPGNFLLFLQHLLLLGGLQLEEVAAVLGQLLLLFLLSVFFHVLHQRALQRVGLACQPQIRDQIPRLLLKFVEHVVRLFLLFIRGEHFAALLIGEGLAAIFLQECQQGRIRDVDLRLVRLEVRVDPLEHQFVLLRLHYLLIKLRFLRFFLLKSFSIDGFCLSAAEKVSRLTLRLQF